MGKLASQITISITIFTIVMALGLAPKGLSSGIASAASDSDFALLYGTNAQRASNGLGNLHMNAQLTYAAEAKANDMVANDYWAHVSPSGVQPWDFINQSGYDYRGAGENLAYGFNSMDMVVSSWMNSPGHRANMLNADYYDVGFAVVTSANFVGTGPETIVVAEFGTPTVIPATTNDVAPAPAAAAPAASAPRPSPTTASAPAGAEVAAEVPQPATPPVVAQQKKTTAKPLDRTIAYKNTSLISKSPAKSTMLTAIAIGSSAPGLYIAKRKSSFLRRALSHFNYLVITTLHLA